MKGLAYCYNACTDAMQPTSLTYSDGEVFSPQYNSDGWLTAASTTPSGGSQVNLLTNVSYSGIGGAAGHLTGANLGNGTYALSASYDDAFQFTSLSITNVSQGTTVFATQRGYDPVGVVTSVNTTLANGTDNQVFCYDSLNRLVWAGSTGTPTCSRTLTPGTLSAANYTATYAYDATNRLTSGSLGTLSYGDSSHFRAATSSTSGETATYDAAGDMQCRAPTSAVTCAGGSLTGARLDYDAERRLTHWQNAQTSPTVQAWYLYDGSGQRVEQYVSGGSGNHTYYLPGGVEEVTPSGSLIKYYSAGGMTIGLNTTRDASGISYLASDGLGSVSEALSPSGTATGAVLYSPYGGVRYSSGVMPTSKGFTGQYSDTASSGLDYYGARYYDPALGQFTSADTVADGINRYCYVAGNPETATDPTGHMLDDGGREFGGGSSGPPPPPPPPPEHTANHKHDSGCGGVILSGNCWTQDNPDSKYNIYKNRVGFDQAFFDVYGNGWGQDWGNAEIAFTKWLIHTNRILYSAYWSFVDAGLITDMFLATLIVQHGGGQSGNGLVQNWLNFMMSPNLYTFWEAHNDSIFGYTFSAQGLADFHAESHNEQLFINDALFGVKSEVVCKLASRVDAGHQAGWSIGASCPNRAC